MAKILEKASRVSFLAVISAFLAIFAAGCGGSGETVDPGAPLGPRAILESEMDDVLLAVESEPTTAFTYCVERVSDGARYVFERDGSTMETAYESASTSKMVSAVIILRLVERGYLSLDDHPQDHLSAAVWPIDDADPLHGITLAQLLGFTSGLAIDPSGSPTLLIEEVQAIAEANAGYSIVPGTQFYYSSNHLQVAGAMAIKARNDAAGGGFVSWQAVFNEFKAETGLFSHSAYDLPTQVNPRLAGGMHWTASDYMEFLGALARGELLGLAMMDQYLMDRTGAGVRIEYSPILAHPAMGEDWHYGFGYWHEFQGDPYAGTPGSRISSPGMYGSYPFWDRATGYFGIVARSGGPGDFPEGVSIERAVRSLVEEWVTLQ